MANWIPSFILFLREGLEASLIIGILMTALRQLGLTHYNKAIWIGVGSALIGSFLVGGVLYQTITDVVGPDFLNIFKTITFIIAVIIITWMTFWVQEHSRTLKKELTEQASHATSGFALGLLAFTTVGREGIETAIFTLAFAFQADVVALLSGAMLGLLVAIGLGVLIYRFGYRLNYRIFFRVMGLLLLVMAAGLLGNALLGMQNLNWLPFGYDQVWDTSSIAWLDERTSIVGSILNVLVGYTNTPTILQVGGFVVYLVIFGLLFWRMTNAPQKPSAPKQVANPETVSSPAR